MNPVGSVLDMVVLVSLARSAAEAPESRALYGAAADEMIDVFHRFEESAFHLADDALTTEQLTDLRSFVAQWRADHPAQRSITFVRLREFSDFRAQIRLPTQGPKSLLGLFMLDPLIIQEGTTHGLAHSRMSDRIARAALT